MFDEWVVVQKQKDQLRRLARKGKRERSVLSETLIRPDEKSTTS
jgi:hypothetical protein